MFLATAFAATVAAVLTGASIRGETRESGLAVNCAEAAWPKIPAACIAGEPMQDVRYVTADTAFSGPADRFSSAFQ